MRRSPWFLVSVFSAVLLAPLGCATSQQRTSEKATYTARKQLARELMVRGDWTNAFAYADELHRQQPDDAEVLVLRGVIYRERNLPAEALADVKAALALDDRNAAGHAALAILLDSAGKGSEAEVHHRRAVALEPKNVSHLNNLGFSLLTRRKSKQAAEVLQQAARLDPTGRRVRTNLGFAYAALGDLPRAAAEFEMGGAPAEAKNNLGFAYESRGDLGNAYTLYASAVRLDPGCKRARNNLTHVAQALGRPLPSDLVGDTKGQP